MESIKPQPCRMVGCFRINMKSDTDDYFYIKRCSLIGVYRVFSAVKPGYIYLPRSGYMSPSTGDCDSCWLFGIRTLSGHLWVCFFCPKWRISTNVKSETLNEGYWHCSNPPVVLDKVSKDNWSSVFFPYWGKNSMTFLLWL